MISDLREELEEMVEWREEEEDIVEWQVDGRDKSEDDDDEEFFRANCRCKDGRYLLNQKNKKKIR